MRESSQIFRQAYRDSMPVICAYFPLAVVFGVLFVHLGYEWYLAVLMSVTVYAGVVQFLVLTMMDNHASLLAILVPASFVAFRNAFYGISLLQRFKNCSRWLKLFFIFGLVDGVYALFVAKPEAPIRYCFHVNWLIYFHWILGTLIGAVFANYLPDVKGMEFIMPCFFMVLVIDFFLKFKSRHALIIPVVASFIAYILLSGYYLVLAILLSFLFVWVKTARGSV